MASRKKNTEARKGRIAGETVVGLFADLPAAQRGIEASPNGDTRGVRPKHD